MERVHYAFDWHVPYPHGKRPSRRWIRAGRWCPRGDLNTGTWALAYPRPPSGEGGARLRGQGWYAVRPAGRSQPAARGPRCSYLQRGPPVPSVLSRGRRSGGVGSSPRMAKLCLREAFREAFGDRRSGETAKPSRRRRAMVVRSGYVDGERRRADAGAPDMEAAKRFYGVVLGLGRFVRHRAAGGTTRSASRTTSPLPALTRSRSAGGGPPAWNTYLIISDARTTAVRHPKGERLSWDGPGRVPLRQLGSACVGPRRRGIRWLGAGATWAGPACTASRERSPGRTSTLATRLRWSPLRQAVRCRGGGVERHPRGVPR